jgi:phosphoribosylamine--glycine ligase
VIEFNARFGDPETQALIPRLDSNLADLCMAAATGGFGDGWSITWTTQACVAVVLASEGYPGSYPTGIEISGLDEASALEDVAVFHAGTAKDGDRVVTAGGRVAVVSALGDDVAAARRRAYEAAALIDFEGKHLRTDIAARAVSQPTAAAGSGSAAGSDDERSDG